MSRVLWYYVGVSGRRPTTLCDVKDTHHQSGKLLVYCERVTSHHEFRARQCIPTRATSHQTHIWWRCIVWPAPIDPRAAPDLSRTQCMQCASFSSETNLAFRKTETAVHIYVCGAGLAAPHRWRLSIRENQREDGRWQCVCVNGIIGDETDHRSTVDCGCMHGRPAVSDQRLHACMENMWDAGGLQVVEEEEYKNLPNHTHCLTHMVGMWNGSTTVANLTAI